MASKQQAALFIYVVYRSSFLTYAQSESWPLPPPESQSPE
jgi:hypothetical protein